MMPVFSKPIKQGTFLFIFWFHLKKKTVQSIRFNRLKWTKLIIQMYRYSSLLVTGSTICRGFTEW
jgi:hypothetical protein